MGCARCPLAPTILLQEYDTRSRRRCASGLQAGAAFVCVMSLLDSCRISSRYAVAKTLDQDHSRRFWLIAPYSYFRTRANALLEEGWPRRPPSSSHGAFSTVFGSSLFRRPAIAATLSLALVVALIVLSRLKHDIVSTTISFFDVLIIDQ